MEISFRIPGQPVAKGRPIAKRRKGKTGEYIAMMTPEKTANYENLVRISAALMMAGHEPTAKPIVLSVGIFLQIPASWSNRRREKAAAGAIYATNKPDADNILKAIKDGCNGVVWRDDSQVVRISLEKRYSETPCALVKVIAIDGETA